MQTSETKSAGGKAVEKPPKLRFVITNKSKTVEGKSLPPPKKETKKEVKVEDDWPIYKVATEATPIGWEKVFESALPDFKVIDETMDEDFKKTGKQFIPRPPEMFTAFHLTPLDKVKVVIFGQDPYHTMIGSKSIAHGLSFSIRRGQSIPARCCLLNIYKELNNTVEEFNMTKNGCLESWAKQGVLMLNSCLTTRPNEAGAHSKYTPWFGFLEKVLKAIEEVNPKCIYVLWGGEAQKIRNKHQLISDKAIVLESAHPSGLSAHKGFFGCDHFNKINAYLGPENAIDWNVY